MRTGSIAAVLVGALCVPLQAAAEAELRLGIEAAAEYDDNVLVRSENVLGDFLGRIGPRMELRDEQGRLLYEVRYFPSYEKFEDLSELDGWNHDAFAKFTWRASDRTSIILRDQYLDTNRATQALAVGEPIDPSGEAASVLGRRGFTQNVAYGELLHQLTHVDQLSFTAQNVMSDDDPFQDLTVTESDVTSVGLSWLRALSARNQAGLLLRYTDQRFDNLTVDTETRSRFYNASVQWTYRIDPTWLFSVSAGPAWVTQDLPESPSTFSGQPLYPLIQGANARGPVLVDSCPTRPDGIVVLSPECEVVPESRLVPRPAGFEGLVFREDLADTTDLGVVGDLPETNDDGLTYFASLALTKQWQTVTASLRYSRDASTTAAASGNVRDIVQANINWQPTERWRFGFVAAWEQRDQETTSLAFDGRALIPATAVVFDPSSPTGLNMVPIGQSSGLLAREIDRSVTNDRYTLSLNVQYRLTRRTSLFARLYWIDQTTEDDFVGARNATRFDAVIGVRYYLDPIQLPL
jgi:hypothetical protein